MYYFRPVSPLLSLPLPLSVDTLLRVSPTPPSWAVLASPRCRLLIIHKEDKNEN